MLVVLEQIEQKFSPYVIVGSYALYLQKLIPTFSRKDIDIIVNVPQDHLDNERDVKKHSPTRFSDYGWTFKAGDMWVEAFNDELPQYDILEVQGIKVKVRSIPDTIKFYTGLDIDKIGGHFNFTTKLQSRKHLVTQLDTWLNTNKNVKSYLIL